MDYKSLVNPMVLNLKLHADLDSYLLDYLMYK